MIDNMMMEAMFITTELQCCVRSLRMIIHIHRIFILEYNIIYIILTLILIYLSVLEQNKLIDPVVQYVTVVVTCNVILLNTEHTSLQVQYCRESVPVPHVFQYYQYQHSITLYSTVVQISNYHSKYFLR